MALLTTLRLTLSERLGRFIASLPGKKRRPGRLTRSRRLGLEQLEVRQTPATHIWSGAVSALWSDARNWSVGGSPLGDTNGPIDLVYPASGAAQFTSTDDDAGMTTQIHSIRFEGVGYDLTAASGHQVQLGGDITAANTSGGNIIDFDLSLTASDHTMTVAGIGVLAIHRNVKDGAQGMNLNKDGAGELGFFADSNGYQNSTHVRAGTLRAAGVNSIGKWTVSAMVVDSGATLAIVSAQTVGSLAGGGNVNFEAPTELFIGPDDTSTTFSGVISGQGGISKGGTGTLTLTNHNTYTGHTFLYPGTLLLGADNALPTGTTVYFVPGTGSSTTLDLANHNATVQWIQGGDTGATVNLGTGTLTLNPLQSVTYAGVISGTGGVVMNGPSQETLTGANTWTGPTQVTGGTLMVNGSLSPSSSITVSGTGHLAGTGTVGPVQFQAGGFQNPGTATIGTLTSSGPVTFASGSSFQARLNRTAADYGSDRLAVQGAVDLTGGPTLNLALMPNFASTSGDTFTLLTATSITGHFVSADGRDLTENATFSVGGTTFRINYITNGSGASVVLTNVTSG